MTTKHTPGPWVAERAFNGWGDGFAVITRDELVITQRAAWPKRASEMQANAHLIAAAPELLEALEDCVRALEAWATLNNEPDEPETTRARAVIAKAEGRSNG